MPTLLQLLDRYFFVDVPGLQARAALVSAWVQVSGTAWNELYVRSLNDALAEELPHLSAFTGHSTRRPTHTELTHALTSDLGEPGNILQRLDLTSGAFLTELARAMQAQRLILINQHNLFTDEYRQILLNLFDHAHSRFKTVITDRSAEFSNALGHSAQHDAILVASIVLYLARQFGIALSLVPPPSPPPPDAQPDANLARESSAADQPEPISAPEDSPHAPAISETAPLTAAYGDNAAPTMTAAEISPAPSSEPVAPRPIQNRLRVLLATPGDVQDERALLTKLIQDADARARARFGVELEMVNPTPADLASVNSAVELADIFIGVVWTQFGKAPVETNAAAGASVFAGTENDFASALEQAVGRGAGSLRTVVYRSIHPPDDLLHLNLAEYTQVHEFFARVGDYAGEDFIRVYTDASELVADAQARLEAWAFNYAGDLANALAEHGNASAALGQNSGALDDFAQAISLYHELDRPEQELVLWLRVAAICRRENQRDQAADALDAALRLARLVEDDESAAHALHQTGLLAADAQDWRNAQRAFQQARAYLEPDAALRRVILADEISAQENLGDAAHSEGDPLRAREAYRDALVLAQESGAAPRAAALWHKLGAVAAERGEWADARDAYAQALALLDADASPETRADLLDAQAAALMQLARQARAAGDSETAASEYRAALAASEQGRNPPARRVEIFAALGALAAERESWEQAIDWNARALAKVDTLADASRRPSLLYAQAAAYESLGTVRRKAENFASAANAFNEAFALYQELGARTEQGIVLHALGFIAYSQAHWQEALALFTQALGYLDAPDAQEIRFDTLGTRAETFERIGDAHLSDQEWAQAEMAYIQARDYLEQLGLGPHIGTLLTKLGIVTAAQGRREEALAYFQYARTRLTAPEHAQAAAEAMRLEANTLREIADSSRAAGDFLQAHALYRQQLDLAQTLQDTALEGAAFHQLGLVAADQEHWDDAINDYAQAYGLLEDPAHVETRTLIQRHQLAAYQKLGAREHAARQLPQAELAYRSALALAQTFEERIQEADLLYALGLISIQRESWDEALIDLRRALGIYNLQPQAPHKAQVIWNIGRAQRGAKHKQMHDALQRAHTARDAQDWDT
ncbi:MAG: hypothetical protein HY741_04315, partial [Chloroflexi bacterium]|nr:hypothetical protein [Chloroflexota bacterium]